MSAEVEQYKILWDIFNKEIERFWTRYNVLLGVQIAVVVTLLRFVIENAKDQPYIAIIFYFILTLKSAVTYSIISRATSVHKFHLEQIKKFEDNHTECIILSEVGENSPINIQNPLAYNLATVIPIFLFWLWSLLFCWETYQQLKEFNSILGSS